MLVHDLIQLIKSRPDPDVVYHYTTPDGLLGLLSDQSIWSTDVRYLSDAREFDCTVDLVHAELDALRAKYSAGHPEVRLLDELENVLKAAPDIRLYVSSFSEHGNLLSQWRAYCPPTGGFALGITPAVLRQKSGHMLFPCVYDPERRHFLIGEAVGRILNRYRVEGGPQEQEPERLIRIAGYAAEFFGGVLLLAACFKDAGFKEEAEWRPIIRSSIEGESRPLFRTGRSGLVPYVHTPLALGDRRLRIDEVIVGPNPHDALAKQAVVTLLDNLGVVHDGVRLSGIPYRAW